MNSSSKIIIIVGQTATGKSDYAFNLAQKISAEIISCDSMQVYKLMDIGTGKPPLTYREKISHHMLDLIYPNEKFSAAQYAILAQAKIKEIKKQDKNIIIVAGSPLYLKALIDGLFIGPGENKKIREKLQNEAIKFGDVFLYKKLQKIDYQTASKLHPNDKRRIIRALEIYELTGKSISELQLKGNYNKLEYNFQIIGLIRDKEELYKRIELRIDNMIKKGLIEEIENLINLGYTKDLPSMQALGYKETIKYLEKEYDKEKMIDILKHNTKQFAKRQLTWFKKDLRIKWKKI